MVRVLGVSIRVRVSVRLWSGCLGLALELGLAL